MRRIGLALAVVGALAVGSGGVASAEPPGPSCVGVGSSEIAQIRPGARADFQQFVFFLAREIFNVPPGAIISEAAQRHCPDRQPE